MEPIRNLEQLVKHVKKAGVCRKIAVAMAEDENTIGAIAKAVREGIAEAVMIGEAARIREVTRQTGENPDNFTIINTHGGVESVSTAVRMVRSGDADILMKGLVGTDLFLRAVMDKNDGLLPPKAVMSYVCAIELPAYHKLLFVSDTAVLPFPDLNQKIAMVSYAVDMARRFGIDTPRVALLSAAEKVSSHFPSHTDYAIIARMAARGQIKNCIVDGPLDIFLACDPESVAIKGVDTPVDGDADVLIFPSLEASNTFYKGLMLFGGGELGGLIQGTTKPVIVMSRSESAKSKYYCIACGCLMV
jgi:phosphate butyryltransferase